jgi:bacteriorhodopsin|tara:strand:- start:447 stop:650 length:204 start_codon:yes stop_codon:yes gene_type:complete
MSQLEKPSKIWYLVPILFSILGGIVMYLGVKDRSPEMAKKGLIVGILISVIPILAYIAIFASVLISS